jgi:UDP-glucose 4-epimerase
MRIWGDGSSVRDYLYIDDLLALCADVLDANPAPGAHVYNAASGEAIRLDALLDRIEGVTGRTFQRILEPARRVDVHSIVSDVSAARDSFNWTPGVPLATGLERTWQWYCTKR